ncbi:MAG: hypothetical protein ACI4W2_11850 [Eubacterium sp.]
MEISEKLHRIADQNHKGREKPGDRHMLDIVTKQKASIAACHNIEVKKHKEKQRTVSGNHKEEQLSYTEYCIQACGLQQAENNRV